MDCLALEPSHTTNTTYTTLGKLLILIVFQFIEYSNKIQYKYLLMAKTKDIYLVLYMEI